MTASPFDLQKNRVFMTYGHTNERYCLKNGVEVRFEKMLHDHLKRQGFECIVFFGNRGAFFMDQESHDIVTNQGRQQPLTASPVLDNNPGPANVKLASSPGGITFRGRNVSAPLVQPTSRGTWRYPDMAEVNTMVGLVEKILKNIKIKSAVVFSDRHIYSTIATSPLNVRFRQFIEHEISSLPTNNQNIVIFNISGDNPGDDLRQGNWSFLFQESSQGKPTGKATAIYIGPPDLDEVFNYLMTAYLNHNIPVDWVKLPRLVNALTSHIKRGMKGGESYRLQALAPFRIDHIPITEEGVKNMIEKGIEKSAEEQLNILIGMQEVKSYIEKKRQSFRGKQEGNMKGYISDDVHRLVPPPVPDWVEKQRLHLVLTGNPGTGKTTVAKLIGELYRESGLLPIGHTMKVTRADLVSEYVGGTAPKTRGAIQRALGGILFIDEAYDVCRAQDDQYGREAIATLVEAMTDLNGRFMVIIAGYPDDISRFLKENAGMSSRFSERIHLPDYLPGELELILRDFLSCISSVPLNKELDEGLDRLCRNVYGSRDENFSNARDMETLANELYENASQSGSEAIGPEHLSQKYSDLFNQPEVSGEGLVDRLHRMTGLANAKNFISGLFSEIEAEKVRKGADMPVLPGHFLFIGNPGTGKTTVAEIMAEQFFALGILPSKQIKRTTSGNLIQGFVGQSETATREFLNKGLGKVIFIDEAHQLYKGTNQGTDYGQKILDVIVPFAEDHRENCVIILAGYPRQMKNMLSYDPGLKGRFTNEIVFEDYTKEEMVQIFDSMVKEKNMEWSKDDNYEYMEAYFQELKASAGDEFANARTARNTLALCLRRQAARLKSGSYAREDYFIMAIDNDSPEKQPYVCNRTI